MAYAPHHNAELTNGAGEQIRPRLIASFNEKEFGNHFEVADRAGFCPNGLVGEWGPENFPHYIYIDGGQTRMARVLKTVAYIITDEDDMGNPVVEKWEIKGYREYAA